MSKLTAVLPGYATVARASEILHLAPRSVRDLIYAGRLPSLRIGRLHYLRAADVERERRRRLGLPHAQPRQVRPPRPQLAGPASPTRLRQRADPALRAQRAAARAQARAEWAHTHAGPQPALPFRVSNAAQQAVCAGCGAALPSGTRHVEEQSAQGGVVRPLCLRCARRALLGWADERRAEAAAARALAESLASPREGADQAMQAA